MKKFKQVSKEEFDNFINAYPSKLDVDVTGMCEPPLKSYNDFSDGKVGFESVVAMVKLNTAMAGLPGYNGEPDEYRLLDK